MNKLWNSARFIIMNIDEDLNDFIAKPKTKDLDATDLWILSRLNSTIEDVNSAYDSYKMNDAVKIVYDFVYSDFCDWYIELSKTRFYGTDERSRKIALNVSVYCMRTILKLLHPYTPYITEELWTNFSSPEEDMLISESWPSPQRDAINKDIESNLELIKKTISSIRNIRAEMNIPMGKEIDIIIKANKDIETFNKLKPYIIRLAKIDTVTIDSNAQKPNQSASIVINNNEIFIPLKGVIDIDIEMERLKKQLDAYNGRLKNVNNKLNNENFINRAPKEIIENEQKKQSKYQNTIKKIEENLKSFLA